MNIGALDRKITIESQTTAASSTTGERTYTWATLASVWATVRYPQSAERSTEGMEQGRETSSIPVEFTIWHRTDVTEKMRVSYDSAYFDIQRINKVGQRNEMLKLVTVKKI